MRRFEYDDGSSRKFWEIQSEGRRVTVRFGRLGTNGQLQAKDLGSERAAQAHVEKMIGAKLKKGYVERHGVHPPLPEVVPVIDDSGISVERGLKRYMSEHSGACHVLVRKADDPEAAALALGLFRQDLWTSELFASLDGEFGDDIDGTPLRYTPTFASEVQLTADGPEFWFDTQDVLDCWPELAGDLIHQLKQRLEGAGVQRATIGKPRRPYAERVYAGEADWFGSAGKYLSPLHERWLPPSFPGGFPVPAKARVVIANQAVDESWTYAAWHRRKAEDEFTDVLDQWRRHEIQIELLTAPPQSQPDISWGWKYVHRAFLLQGWDREGWAWIVFSKYKPATYLHVIWFA